MGTPYYADISAVGNEYQAYADTPTSWGVPQDGNGKAASAASAAVPLAEVTFAAIPTTGAISVMGVTVTLTGVLSAANTAAAATALAASINATVTATGAAVCQLLLPLNRFVYARVKPGGGANDSIVQIMCRMAGSDLNYNAGANTSARVTNTFNNSAMSSPVDFAGGVDGPWGYLYNTASAFGKAALAYGIWFNATPTPTTPPATDLIHVRTRRSGSDLSVSYTSTANFTISWQFRSYLYDNGTVWSGDNGKLTATFKMSGGGSNVFGTIQAGAGTVAHMGAAYGKFQLEGSVIGTSGATSAMKLFSISATNAKVVAKDCVIEETSDYLSTAAGLTVCDESANIGTFTIDLSGSLIRFRGTAKKVLNSTGSTVGATGPYSARLVMNGAQVAVISATGAISPFIAMTGSGAYLFLEWIGGAVYDTNNTYTCATPISSSSKFMDVLLDSVSGITNPSVGFTPDINTRHQMVWYQAQGSTRGYRYERPQYSIDWTNNGTFPYAAPSADMDGTAWSVRVAWNSAPSVTISVTPLKITRRYRGTTGSKTIALEMYVPDSTAFYLDEMELEIVYVDASDVLRIERVGGSRQTQLAGTRTALSSSSKSWTASGLAAHSAKKLSITTAQSIKSGTEYNLRLSLCASRGTTLSFYVSQEPTET
jgi:hypothetical protein